MHITDYTDYQCFLRDFIVAEKRRRPSFSFGRWAKDLKLQSPSTLIMLVRRQRNPSDALTDALVRYFKFNGEDAECFRDLVHLKKNHRNSEIICKEGFRRCIWRGKCA